MDWLSKINGEVFSNAARFMVAANEMVGIL